MKNIIIFLLIITYPIASYSTPSISHTPITNNKSTIAITIPLKHNDWLYKEYLCFSTDHPKIALSDWTSNCSAEAKYDPHFQETKKVFTQPITITLDAAVQTDELVNTNLHMTYYLKSEKKLIKKSFPLVFNQPLIIADEPELTHAIEVPSENQINPSLTQEATPISKQSWSDYFSHIVSETESWWMKIIFAFLLGILLSFTPCIYPMIPITAGILQTQHHYSLHTNFFRSLCYTVGLSTTFALLGLIAAFTGQLFGALVQHPAVIIGFALLLLYSAFSMLGFYQLYIPSFFANKRSIGSSYGAAFLYGMASGAIASPCVSPGLLALLSLVATTPSLFMGFILLFLFGIGLTLPLLIVGTLASSINLLPQAGPWMIEIKRFFGFVLIGMSVYLMRTLVPIYVVLVAFTALLITIGITYFVIAHKESSLIRKTVKNNIGYIMLASSVFILFKAAQSYYQNPLEYINWQTDYATACALACNQHKPLLIDIGSPYCSLCSSIDNYIFCNEHVADCCNKDYIALKIDGSEKCCETLKQKYTVLGVPSILLVDPETETVIKKWGGELYHQQPQQFIAQLRNIEK